MKLSNMKPLEHVVEEHRQDAAFGAEWDRTAFARDVANKVVRHRTEHRLSQRQLAELVGLLQPAIARLERADHQPSFETLAKLSRATGLAFHLEVANGGVELVDD